MTLSDRQTASRHSATCLLLWLNCVSPCSCKDIRHPISINSKILDSWHLCVAAEAGGARQEGFKHQGAAAERAPLPQTPPGAALGLRIRGAHPHRQPGLHHLHRLRARYADPRHRRVQSYPVALCCTKGAALPKFFWETMFGYAWRHKAIQRVTPLCEWSHRAAMNAGSFQFSHDPVLSNNNLSLVSHAALECSVWTVNSLYVNPGKHTSSCLLAGGGLAVRAQRSACLLGV